MHGFFFSLSFQATLIRDCESELVPCLSSTPEAKIAFAASSRGKKVPPPPAPPLPFPPPSSISPTYLSSGEFMRDLDGLSSCSSPPSSSGRPCTGLAVLNSALFARTLNNVQFQIARGFKSKRHKVGDWAKYTVFNNNNNNNNVWARGLLLLLLLLLLLSLLFFQLAFQLLIIIIISLSLSAGRRESVSQVQTGGEVSFLHRLRHRGHLRQDHPGQHQGGTGEGTARLHEEGCGVFVQYIDRVRTYD